MRVMRFRPCIDIHDGRVKQIVGGTLTSSSSSSSWSSSSPSSSSSSSTQSSEQVSVNFETEIKAGHFASLYRQDDLPGGHVIMLGRSAANEAQAQSALSAYPGGLHVGGGINPENAKRYLTLGASHVIVTSYVFQDGLIAWDRVKEMQRAIGKNRLVLDVSARKLASDGEEDENGRYMVVTDRWQKWTKFEVNADNVGRLGEECDELLIHAVDVEGLKQGFDVNLIRQLADWVTCPVTYAGGIVTIDDLNEARGAGRGLIDVTIGSALDIFGGTLPYSDVVKWQRIQEETT